MNPPVKRVPHVRLAILSVVLALIWGAQAQPTGQPTGKFFVTDGVVNAMTRSENFLYIGGQFSQVGWRSGCGVPISATTGQAQAGFPFINGAVNSVIPDNSGGWFLGGSFTVAGAFLRTNVVHIRADRSIDPTWSPVLAGGVTCLTLDGGSLYAGGSFTNANGQVRSNLVALDASTGVLNSWNPGVNGRVACIAVVGTNVYVSGEFSSVSGSARSYIAAIDRITGQPTSWNPGASDWVQAMVTNSGHLYVGGYFSTIAGQTRSKLASFDLSTGNLDAWNPGAGTTLGVSPVVWAMGAYQNSIFVGGQFTSIGGSNRVNIAALDASTGIATAWNANQPLLSSSGFPSDYVVSLQVHSNLVYVGGPLVNIGNQPRLYAAALDADTAQATSWDPKLNMQAAAFSRIGDTVYVGGLFSAVGCVARTNLAALDVVSNQIADWNPVLLTRSGVPVNTLLATNGQVFVGGFFTDIGGTIRTNLAAVDATTGSVLSWTPDPNATVFALAVWNNRLYVGGGFNNVSGMAISNLVEFDLNTGYPTGWDPAVRSLVQALAVDGDTLYAGGAFSTASGQTRRRIAAFDLPSSTLTTWNPGITNGSVVRAISVAGGRVVIGGSFNVINGNNRTNFAVLDAATGLVLPGIANADNVVYGVAAGSNTAFVCGNFQNMSGQKRGNIASVDLNSGALTSWNPSADFYVQAVNIFDSTLYAGGAFLRLGDTARSLAAFPLALTGPPSIVTNSARRLADSSFQFRLLAEGVPQVTVLTSTNMQNWQTSQPAVLVSGVGLFTDTGATNRPKQFYRLQSP